MKVKQVPTVIKQARVTNTDLARSVQNGDDFVQMQADVSLNILNSPPVNILELHIGVRD